MVKVVFVLPPNPVLATPLIQPPLGALYVAASLERAGYSVQVADLRDKTVDVSLIPEADFYCFSFTTAEYDFAIELAELLRQRNPKSIMVAGGPHPTVLPDTCLDYFEAVCVGEGEELILQVMRGARGVLSHPPIKDLDAIPFPARHLLGERGFSRTLYVGEKYGLGPKCTSLTTSRGCPFNCHFCASARTLPVRFRSPENVYAEIKELMEKWRCRYFRFVDDNYTLNKERLYKICELLEPLKIRYRCHTRSNLVTDELAEALVKSHCTEVGLGVETCDDKVLKFIGKDETVEDHENAIQTLKAHGLKVKTFIMTGLPKEDWSVIEKIKQFFIRQKPDKYTLNVYQPYPGSEMWRHPQKFGIKILKHSYSDLWNFSRSIIETDVASNEELNQHYEHLYTWLRSEKWKS